MNENTLNRLEKMEILFSEQEYTLQTLNEIVTRHADKIDQLENLIEYYKEQIKTLQEAQSTLASEQTTDDERPPHY